MAKTPKMTVVIDKTQHDIEVQIDVSPEAMGHHATLCLQRHVRVKDRRRVDQTQDVFQHDFRIEHRTTTCTIPARSFSVFLLMARKLTIAFLLITK